MSLTYAVGLLPLDGFAGYGLPGGAFPEGIIPSPLALAASQQSLEAQKQALLDFHSQLSTVAATLPAVSTQIMFISGIQDDIIPILTQVQAADMTPGAWLIQVPDAGHVSFKRAFFSAAAACSWAE